MGHRRDDDDDDLGFRTPTRKLKKNRESGKQRSAERKRASGKHRSADRKKETGRTRRKETGRSRRKESGRARKESGRTRRKETGRARRPKSKSKTGEVPAVEAERPARTLDRAISEKLPRVEVPAGGSKGGPPIALLAGIVFVGGLAGMVALVMLNTGEPKKLPELSKGPKGVAIVDEPNGAQAIQPKDHAVPVLDEPRVAPPKPDQPGGAPAVPVDLAADALEQLSKKSATHAAVARILGLLDDLHDPKAMLSAGPLGQHFRERQKREEELIEELRAMGPTAVDALKDMLLGLDGRQHRIFLGRALSGIEGPGALDAVKAILGEIKDVALQTTMVRTLPQNRDSTDTVKSLIENEENANLRTMLMREYHRRLGDDLEGGRDLFRTAAREDPDANVRAEAVTIIGRRGDPRDMGLMEDIISEEKNLSIRQRAIVSYAETGKAGSLPFLEQMVRNPDTVQPISASAVLAIGRIGGQQALQSLDLIAQTHQDQEIRTRANRLAQSLRRRAQEKNNPRKRPVDRNPMRVEGRPLRRSQ